MKVKPLEPADLVAIVVIAACSILIGLGKDGEIKNILFTVVGFFFGAQAKARLGRGT